MKETLKQLILDFHTKPLPEPHHREQQITLLDPPVRKTYVLIGMRRTGKTWMLYQDMHTRLNQGLEKEKLLYLNFEDDRLASFQQEHFQTLCDAYYELYPKHANGKDVIFYFDEIHLVEGWEKFIRRLLEQEQMQIVITGSSAKLLSKEIATSLRGRALSQEIFPFSFREYLTFKEISLDLKLSTKNKALLRHHAQYYVQHGGFPETLFVPEEMHAPLLQDYINTVIFRDVIERHNLQNHHIVKRFLLHLLQNLAAPLSVTKIFHTFKSQGEALGKNSLYEYLGYYEDAYAIFAVPIYQHALRKRQMAPKKIYAVDPGLVLAYSIKPKFERGVCLENAVFAMLRRKHQEIFYYLTENKKEIDFLTLSPKGEISLYQVCLNLQNPNTQKREINAILEATKELGLNKATLITEDEERELTEKGIKIQCVPYWKWAWQTR